jgi:hypothetical protein
LSALTGNAKVGVGPLTGSGDSWSHIQKRGHNIQKRGHSEYPPILRVSGGKAS